MSDSAVLGRTVQEPVDGLDTFPTPAGVTKVHLAAMEGTSVCPVTGQPDMWTADITYWPRTECVESKSMKLWLWKFRNEGVFCEQLSADIAREVGQAIGAAEVEVTVRQSPRGGIAINSTARYSLMVNA
jgi:7-cyano-7-deazaguanine reductase